MKSIPAVAPLLALALVVATSAGARVRAEHDPEARFTGRSTFGWKLTEGQAKFAEAEPFLAKHLRSAIRTQLEKKSLRLVEEAGADADLLVSYKAETTQRLEVHEDPDWFPNRGWWDEDLHVTSYDEVTYIVDVWDGGSGELMWRGKASEPEAGEGRAQRQIERLMQKLFRKYPPR